MIKQMLVAYDFSDAARRALEWAAGLQRSVGGAMVVLHVVDPTPSGAALSPMPLPILTEGEQQRIEGALRDAAASAGAKATIDLRINPSAGAATIECARQLNADLIVVGTRGQGGVKRALLGSTADHLVRHADCPVVTIRDAT